MCATGSYHERAPLGLTRPCLGSHITAVQMTFPEWLDDVYRLPTESRSSALSRLAGATGISYKALFYAAKGARTTPETALALREFSGDKIDAGALVLAPTREELKTNADEEDAAE